MFTLPIHNDQRQYAWGLVQKINFGTRRKKEGGKDTNGNEVQQYTGILGQVILADALGKPRPLPTDGYDQGVDFFISGYAVDLKTMAREYDVSPSWVNNLWESQVNDPRSRTEVYAFSSINKKKGTFTFCGLFPKHWIAGNNGVGYHAEGTIRNLVKAGMVVGTFPLKAGMYEVPNDRLIRVDSPFEIPDKVRHIFEVL